MFDTAKTRQIQADLQKAVAEVLKSHGAALKSPIDLRRSRDQSFGRVMKFDIEALSASSTVNAAGVAKPKIRKGSSLETAMKAYGITNKTNSKGDTLVSYHPNRPKYPFVYQSIRGARWKADAAGAKRRFG